MAFLKSASSPLVAAMVAATLLSLSAAAPLSKARRSTEQNLLTPIYAGLNVLYNVSVRAHS